MSDGSDGMRQLLVWTDVETSGLDPTRDTLLEIAVVLTWPSLDVVGKPFHGILSFGGLRMRDVAPEVLRMHVESRLWRDCAENGKSADEVRGDLEVWVHEHLVPAAAGSEEPPMLAGSSVHFDRRWLERYRLSSLLGTVSHRHLDLSSVKAGTPMWSPWYREPQRAEGPRDRPGGEWPPHRALTDLAFDLRRARHMREHLFGR